MIISGFGFSGWTAPDDDKVEKPKWTRAKNVDIVKVEFAKSGVELPMYWNISVSTWLRHCMLSPQALTVMKSYTKTFPFVCTIRLD